MERKPLEDTELLTHLSGLPEDCRRIMLLADGQVRLTALSGTAMINSMRANHSLGVPETLVLGQAFIGCALMTSSVKGNDRITLSVECGGPVGNIFVEAWACGGVRGYLANNPIRIEKPLESRNLSELYGPGFIIVSKILEGSRTPFTGQVMMQYGDLAKDLALYYRESEQTPTMFSLGIHFDSRGRVMGAGGLFIQAMPGCSSGLLEELQEKSTSLEPLGKILSTGEDIEIYCNRNFGKWKPKTVAVLPLMFSCPCSRNKFRIFLQNLPESEKKAIIRQNTWPLTLECFNCSSTYSFTEQEIKEIFR